MQPESLPPNKLRVKRAAKLLFFAHRVLVMETFFAGNGYNVKFNVATSIVITYICSLMKIEEAIKQKKFESEFQKVHINIMYTANWLSRSLVPELDHLDLTWQQFNILRILRGMHPEPATIKLLTERMIDKMSNASRLVEKLKKKGMVERHSCEFDRRRVDIVLTDMGREVLEEASQQLKMLTAQTFSTLTVEEAKGLNSLLDRLRG